MGEIVEPAKLVWKLKREKLMGMSFSKLTQTQTKLTLVAAQGINEKIHKDSKLTELKLNPHKNKRYPLST